MGERILRGLGGVNGSGLHYGESRCGWNRVSLTPRERGQVAGPFDYQRIKPGTFVVSRANHERATLRQAQGERQGWHRQDNRKTLGQVGNCYTFLAMNRVLVRVWPVGLAVLMVALPFLGPVIDHHFAERQAYHAHFGADSGHDHGYASLHLHGGDQTAESLPRTGSGGGIALYSFEVFSAGPSMAMLADSELESRLTPDPDAVLTLRAPVSSVLRSESVSPLERPPRA